MNTIPLTVEAEMFGSDRYVNVEVIQTQNTGVKLGMIQGLGKKKITAWM